ncbi:methionine--tRNA ligase [candidate division CSSED10-310 bacterium]|uniref:Methionine--tRNA ligase n=1 Tax=candidate division CSSED10-310 bacterium TaxID=2855610 RepID=A0ABV6Z3K1_UNCC1
MKETFYVTTPIYYVNDIPHIGHAYTTIAADVLARYHRARGREVYFLTGTDEHGQKVERAAQERGISPKDHCDELVTRFQQLWEKLDIKLSYFIRTTDPEHELVVQKAMQMLHDQDLIKKKTYQGWYSTSSERFWMEKDLKDGKDPETGLPVEWISETNYFFLMSRYQQKLKDHLHENPHFIRPKSRYNEILGFLDRELDDLCISRPKSRLAWGIELPFDHEYVTYVWFDALLNYLSAIGYLKEDQSLFTYWPANFHLIGKDILTTHSVYWITMLFALNVPPPQCIFAHGWWTIEGRKMSKSLKNVVDPHLLIDSYGADAVRYFLLREVPFGNDGDFSHAAFIGRVNADLANDLGNALNRSVALTGRNFDGLVPTPRTEEDDQDRLLKNHAAGLLTQIGLNLGETIYTPESPGKESLNFSVALENIWSFIRFINKYIDTQAPWQLAKEGNKDRLATVLYNCLEALRVAAVYLAPFMPNKALQIIRILGLSPTFADQQQIIASELQFDTIKSWGHLPPGSKLISDEILFPRVEPEMVQNILSQILAIAENEEMAVNIFREIFPRYKITKAQTWVRKILGTDSFLTTPTPTPEKSRSKPDKKAGPPAPDSEVDYNTFARLDLRVAEVLEAERVKNSEKLIRLKVDIGSETRQIVAGIGKSFAPTDLISKKIVIVANLKPVKLMGLKSKGMLLAAGDEDDDVQLCLVSKNTKTGLRIK